MKTLFPGIAIEHEAKGVTPGTISFLGHAAGSPATKVVVSNDHVILGSSRPNQRVCSPGAGSCPSCCIKNVVGTSWDGFQGNHPIGGQSFYVDAAKVRLNDDVSGVNLIPGFSGNDKPGKVLGGKILGTNRAVIGERVIVFGMKSGWMFGSVQDPNNFPSNKDKLIVKADPQFAQDIIFGSGDSGAPIINTSNELIGIMFGRGLSDPNSISQETTIIFGCHIAALLDRLQVAFDPAPTPSAGSLLEAPMERSEPEELPQISQEWLARMRAVVAGCPLGRRMLDDVLRHSAETAHLVHHCRPVKVVWHRAKGPAWSAHLLNSWRDPGYLIPGTIDGITLAELLSRMRGALSCHGSSELAAVVEENSEMILGLAGLARVRDIFERLGISSKSVAQLEADLAKELI